MAFFIATNLDTSFDLDTSDRLYVPNDVNVISPQGQAVGPANSTVFSQDVVIDGTVIANTANAIVLEDNAEESGFNTLIIGETGIVRSLNVFANSAIFMKGSDSYLQNYGEISGSWGVFQQRYDDGVVENHGVINGINEDGVFLTDSQNVDVINTGLITGDGGVTFSTSTGRVLNSGTIASNDSFLAAIDSADNASSFTVVNSGLITALEIAIDGSGLADSVVNTGEIQGDVSLQDGEDMFDGRGGTVSGIVRGDDGDDTYIIDDGTITLLEDAGEGTDRVQSAASYELEDNFEFLDMIGSQDIDGAGNALANTITGNIGDNVLDGRDGNDEINGRSGRDLILGGNNNDLLRGQSGDDTVEGGAQNDQVFGGDGADSLDGGNGVDTVSGGDGNDVVSGGAGSDLLNGGTGDDTLFGGGGNDQMNGQDDNDILFGGLGSDTLAGGNGSDTLDGGKAADRLDGGRDDDVMRGGLDANRDTFVFGLNDDRDVFEQYQQGLDDLELDDALWGGGLTEAQVVAGFASLDGADLVFDFGGGDSFRIDASTAIGALSLGTIAADINIV